MYRFMVYLVALRIIRSSVNVFVQKGKVVVLSVSCSGGQSSGAQRSRSACRNNVARR
jgi:hypothetical protein